MHDLVIVGGGGAGVTAALKAKATNRDANVTIISDDTLSYSPCSLPFVISGEIPGLDTISHDLLSVCKESRITCVLDRAVKIDPEKKLVSTKKGQEIPYTSLIIATGGYAFLPQIPGVGLEGVCTLQNIHDAEKILSMLSGGAKKAVIVGAGSISLEVAVAFKQRGLDVSVVQRSAQVLRRSFDPEYSKLVEDKLKENGIEIVFNAQLKEISGNGKVKGVVLADREIPADIVLFGIGTRPQVELARQAGVVIADGGIDTDDLMQTSIDGIYAAGDCVDSRSIVTGKRILSQLGTTAIRHGTVAGMNAVGGYVTFDGALNSMINKIFDLEVGRTGLTVTDAEKEGIETVVGVMSGTTKATYFPGTQEVKVKLIFNAFNRKLIGAQVAGYEGVEGKINLLAYAIAHGGEVEDLMKLKYCYTPPVTPSHNLVVLAAENAFKKLRRMMEVRKRKF